MVLMMHPTIMASGLIQMPSITAMHAKQDTWISPILACIIGYLNVYLVYQLNKMYPKQTIVEYSRHIIGVIPGKILGFIFLLFYLHINGTIIREYGEFINSSFLNRTPMVFILGSMVFVCSLAVRGGLEVIARCAQLVEQFLFIALVISIMLLIPDLRLKYLFPVMENGIAPSIKGAIISSSFYSDLLLIAFLLPFLKDQDRGIKWGFSAVHLIVPTFILFDIIPLLLLGNITGSITYPMLTAIRYIRIADFFEHLEAIVMAIYVGGVFIKISVFFYAVTLGTAQWLNISEYRLIVLPIGILLVLISIWSTSSLQELARFFSTTGPFYMLSIQTIVPLLLLIIALIRNRNKNKLPS